MNAVSRVTNLCWKNTPPSSLGNHVQLEKGLSSSVTRREGDRERERERHHHIASEAPVSRHQEVYWPYLPSYASTLVHFSLTLA